MTPFDELWRRARMLVWRDRATRELEEEMRLHRALRTEALRAAGMNDLGAQHAAARRFGNLTALVEWSLDMWGFASLDRLRLDLRFAVRSLRKTPAFTVAALVTLTLGIGATTSIYALAHALWLKPLPYSEPEQLVEIRDAYTNGFGAYVSTPEIEDLNQLSAFDGVAGYHYGAAIVKLNDEPVRLLVYRATNNLFSVLGTKPAMGRTFLADDAQQAHGPVVVLSDAFWRARFHADRDVVGKTINLYGQSHAIIGVMPRGFEFPQQLRADMWSVMDPGSSPDRRQRGILAIARLRRDVTAARAAAELSALGKRLETSYPASNRGWTIVLTNLIDDTVGASRQAFSLLLGTVGLLLLIACANIAGLFLARNTSRRNELALRAALGATRGRLRSQVFTESILIALIGGCGGIALAYAGAHSLGAMLPSSIPRVSEIVVDANIVAFSVVVSLMTGLLCALAPASRISVASPSDALKGVSRGVVSGGQKIQSGLIVAEVALSLVLLVGAGLMLQTFFRLLGRDRGYAPERVLTLHLTLPFERYKDANALSDLYRTTMASLARVPGVDAVGAVTGYPASNLGYLGAGTLGLDAASGRKGTQTILHSASPDYFRAMSVALRAGRFFTADDRIGSARVLLVNETLAKQLWPNESAVRKTLRLPSELAVAFPAGTEFEVVGVVADMHVGRTPSAELFIPTFQSPSFWSDIVIRTPSDPAAISARVRPALKAIEPDFLIEQMVPMTSVITDLYALQRTQSFMAGLFGALAGLLAAVGLYGLISHVVGQRIREIGIRMALGAQRVDVFRAVVVRGLVLTVVGVMVGGIGAYALILALRTRVFGLSTADPVVFAGASALLLAAAFFACYFPARRATRVDPVAALR